MTADRNILLFSQFAGLTLFFPSPFCCLLRIFNREVIGREKKKSEHHQAWDVMKECNEIYFCTVTKQIPWLLTLSALGGFHWHCLLIGGIISLNTFEVNFVIITNMIYIENLRIYFNILDKFFPLHEEKVYRNGCMWEELFMWTSKGRCKNSHFLWLWTVTNAYVGLKKAGGSALLCVCTGNKEH